VTSGVRPQDPTLSRRNHARNPRRISRDFAQTNRLRTEGTRNLLYAAEQVGAKRVITQSLACIYEPNGWRVAFMTELRGADNTLARRILDWTPRYSSWRQGFAAELAHAS
jgi:hypothetical protein